MATIQERKKKNGKVTYTATIRVKGHPPISATFDRKSDANRWIQETEPKIRRKEMIKISTVLNRYQKYIKH